MDLSTIVSATQKVAIRHPASGRPTGLIIELSSLDAEPVQKVRRKHLDDGMRSRQRLTVSAELLDAQMIEQLQAAVVGWEWQGDAAWGGTKLPYTPANVGTVLKAPWLRRQLEEAVANEAAFFVV